MRSGEIRKLIVSYTFDIWDIKSDAAQNYLLIDRQKISYHVSKTMYVIEFGLRMHGILGLDWQILNQTIQQKGTMLSELLQNMVQGSQQRETE